MGRKKEWGMLFAGTIILILVIFLNTQLQPAPDKQRLSEVVFHVS